MALVSNGLDCVAKYDGYFLLLLVEPKPPYSQLIQINDNKLDAVIALLESAKQEQELRTAVHEP